MEIVLIILGIAMGIVHGQECFVPGQCVDSNLIDRTFAEDDRTCLLDCQNVDMCKWFTYKPHYNLCELLSNCGNRTTAECPDCTSGETDCSAAYQCEISGLCHGHMITSRETSSYNLCLTECVETENCGWVTFEDPIKMCYLFTECITLDETCSQCISGEAGCQLQNDGYTKILIASGIGHGQYLANVEVVDISDQHLNCTDLPEYPLIAYGSVGGLLGTTPVICGGVDINTCYALANEGWNPMANMSHYRYLSASAVVGTDMLLVMGGHPLLDTSDVVELNSSKPGPKLPGAVLYQCAVALNETTVMMIGGEEQPSTTYYYHLDIDHWMRGPDLNIGREAHSCATIKSNNHVTVVVAGCYKTTTVEFLSTGASEWSFGTDLPVAITAGQLVPDATGIGLFMIGGYDSKNKIYLDTIFHLACADCEWTEMTQTLKTGRSNHVAFPVPDNIVTCQ